VGQPWILTKIVIGNRRFSAIASYGLFGFISSHVVENEAIDADRFVRFVREQLTAVVEDHHYAIIDNARTHKTPEALLALENCFQGRYYFSPKYSPDNKPIELGFANIKRYLRENEYAAMANPLEWIDRSFRLFSVNGPNGITYMFLCNFYCFILLTVCFCFWCSSQQLAKIF
jgi:transposase